MRAAPVILEPVMAVEVRAPTEFQGTIIGDLNRRKGIILNSEGEGDQVVMQAQVWEALQPLPHACMPACTRWVHAPLAHRHFLMLMLYDGQYACCAAPVPFSDWPSWTTLTLADMEESS